MRELDLEQRDDSLNPLFKPRIIDLFSGCGGFSHGFMSAGFEVVGFVEHWQPAIDTFQKNHPTAIHIGRDITKVENDYIRHFRGNVDIIIGGPPCQGFSICGNRNKKDKRNQLYKQFLRFVAVIQPKLVIIENVPGLLSMKDSNDEPVIHKILNNLIEMDYLVTYKILNAVEYKVPQQRKRLVIIAQRCDFYPKPNTEVKTVKDAIFDLPFEETELNAHCNFTPTEETIEKIKLLKEGEKLSQKFNTCRQRIFGDKPAPTIVTKPLYIHPIYNRFLTPRESARLQSFPDSFFFCGSKSDMVTQIGNAVPPLLAQALAEKIKKVMFNETN